MDSKNVTIEKLIESAQQVTTDIDQQIHTLMEAIRENEEKLAAIQTYLPEDAKKRADLRIEQQELRAALELAHEERLDLLDDFSQNEAIPNMYRIESQRQLECHERNAPKIAELHEIIHKAKALSKELSDAYSQEQADFKALRFQLQGYLNADASDHYSRSNVFAPFSATDYSDPLIVKVMDVLDYMNAQEYLYGVRYGREQ